jgi:putative lipoprotein
MKKIYRTTVVVLVSIFGALLFQGCATSNAPYVIQKEALHVKVISLDKKMLPANAKVTLLLEDIARQDVTAKVLVKQDLMVKNPPPYSFTIMYDPSSIDFKRAYNLSANITVDGKFIYRSDTVLDPFREIKDEYEITLKKVQKNTTLTDISWNLISINGENIKANKDMKKPYILFEKDGKSVKGFGGCNDMFGSFEKDGENIKIGPLASTRKACMNGMDTEAEFHKAISETKKWYVHENVLKLSNKNGKILAEFKSK